MTQTPDHETILHCLDRARDVLGPAAATMLTDALADAWGSSADRGSDAALFASGWLSARAHRWRSIDPVMSNFLSRLAELSASAWVDEIAVRAEAAQLPDFLPDDFERGPDDRPDPTASDEQRAAELAEPSEEARPSRLSTRAPLDVRQDRSADQPPDREGDDMSLLSRRAEPEPMPPLTSDDLEPNPAIAKRLADLKQDDPRTYVETGGDLSLWPASWNQKGDDWYIEAPDRKYYSRDRAEDLKIVEQMREHVRQANVRGVAQRVTIEEAERICHKQAVARARALRKQAEQLARDAQLDRTTYRCESCDTTGDHSVKLRQLPGVAAPTPLSGVRVCDPCTPVVEQRLLARIAARTDKLAEQPTPSGQTRGDLAAVLAERLLP